MKFDTIEIFMISKSKETGSDYIRVWKEVDNFQETKEFQPIIDMINCVTIKKWFRKLINSDLYFLKIYLHDDNENHIRLFDEINSVPCFEY